MCYQELEGSGYTYDFEKYIVLETPSCINGEYDPVTRECVEKPFCKLGGIEIMNEQGLMVCSKDLDFECKSSQLTYTSDASVSELFMKDSDYIIGACEVNNPCGATDTLVYIDGIQMCASDNLQTKCPEDYYPIEYNGVTQCLSTPRCKEGWILTNGTCSFEYTWNEYFCDTDEGWEESNEIYKETKNSCEDPINQHLPECQVNYISGGDCFGSCATDGCSCNPAVAPANSCRKAVTIGSNSNSYSVLQKRLLDVHEVSGNTLAANEMNLEPRGIKCGRNEKHCEFSLNKITGEDSKLCFEKKNGEKECFEAKGCSFFGEIKPSEAEPDDSIRSLKLMDPYTLRTNFYQLMGDLGKPNICRIGEYDPLTEKCAGTMPMEDWTVEGNPSSGNWSLRTAEGEQEFYQANNLLNTMYVYPDEVLNQYTIAGQIKPRVDHKNSIGLVFGWESDSSMYLIDWGSKSYWCRSYGNCGLNLNGMSYGALNLIKVNSTEEAYGVGNYMRKNSDLLATNLNPDWNYNNWYDIKAIVNGGNIKVFIDDTEYLDYTLPNGEVFPEGKVGFFNLSTPGVSYRRFKVSNMEPECLPYAYFDERDGHCHNYTCQPGYTLDIASNTCVQSISSTCKMNGNVGWENRLDPIISIGNSPNKSNITNMTVTGTADWKDGTSWTGFNAATMAIEYSDGFWYTIANVRGPGGEITRDMPKFLRLLPNNHYSIADDTAGATSCNYKNTSIDSALCGNKVLIKSPKEKIYITRILDIESLHNLYGGSANPAVVDNENRLNFKFESNGIEKSYISNGGHNPIIVNEDATVIEVDHDFEVLNNRLRFWDSYIDGDIGFIEFVNEVNEEDRLDGFVPEFIDYEELMAKGFTSIRMLSEKDGYLDRDTLLTMNQTYFIRPKETKVSDCESYANEFGLIIVDKDSFNVVEEENLYKSMGIKEKGACILQKEGILIPSIAKWAVKSKTYEGNVNYVCSPYTCEDHACKVLECPVNSDGGLIPEDYPILDDQCMEDKCDGNLEYIPFCGRLGDCPTDTPSEDPAPRIYQDVNTIKTVIIDFNENAGDPEGDIQANDYCNLHKLKCDSHKIDSSNLTIYYIEKTTGQYTEQDTTVKCQELYCDRGTLNSATKECEVEQCPSGTSEVNGKCIHN